MDHGVRSKWTSGLRPMDHRVRSKWTSGSRPSGPPGQVQVDLGVAAKWTSGSRPNGLMQRTRPSNGSPAALHPPVEEPAGTVAAEWTSGSGPNGPPGHGQVDLGIAAEWTPATHQALERLPAFPAALRPPLEAPAEVVRTKWTSGSRPNGPRVRGRMDPRNAPGPATAPSVPRSPSPHPWRNPAGDAAAKWTSGRRPIDRRPQHGPARPTEPRATHRGQRAVRTLRRVTVRASRSSPSMTSGGSIRIVRADVLFTR
jgi:hypothetical protein